jgi:hypothetical protein
MKRKKKLSGYERFMALSDAEKAAEVAQYDKDFDQIETRPLSAEGRAIHRRAAKKGRGRPKIGQGSRRVVTTVERGLLSRADAFAKAHGMTRAQVIARGLEMVTAA